MAECRNIEEFIHGPEGDSTHALKVTLEDVKKEVNKIEEERRPRIECECRSMSAGTTSTSQEWTTAFNYRDPTVSLLQAIHRKIMQSPGEGFSGTIRLNFRAIGDTHTRFGSYTRKVRPALLGNLDGDGTGEGATRAQIDNMVKPMADMVFRAMTEGTALIHACAHLVAASHPPAPPAGAANGYGMLPDLLKGVVQMAGADKGTVNAAGTLAAGVAAYGAPPPGYVPPPAPPGMTVPDYTPPAPTSTGPPVAEIAPAVRSVSKADVMEWTRNNPEESKRMVLDAIAQGAK